MKTILWISLLGLFVSCSTSRVERKISDGAWDSLADESYLRWGEDRLKSITHPEHKVISCYQGKAKDTLEIYKKDNLLVQYFHL